MATKKEKRLRMQAKREKFMAIHREAGLKAQQEDQKIRENRMTQAELEIQKIQRNRKAVDAAIYMQHLYNHC